MNKTSVKSTLDQKKVSYLWTKLSLRNDRYKLSLTPILDTYIFVRFDHNEQVNKIEFYSEIYQGSNTQRCKPLSWTETFVESSNFELMLSQFIAGVLSYEECFHKVKNKMNEINSIYSLYELSSEDFDFRHQSKLIKQD